MRKPNRADFIMKDRLFTVDWKEYAKLLEKYIRKLEEKI